MDHFVPQHEYSEWVVKARRTIVAVLEDLPSFKPPLDHLLELLPRLQARYYSISSSSKVAPLTPHLSYYPPSSTDASQLHPHHSSAGGVPDHDWQDQ